MEITNGGSLDKKEKEEDLIEFIINKYYVSVKMNSTKDKIIFNASEEEIGKIYYSKEFEIEELYDLFHIKEIPNVFKAISKEIYSNELTIEKRDDVLDLKLNNNIILILYRMERSKEDIENLLIDKLNYLIREKKNYKNGWEERKLFEKQKEEHLTRRMNTITRQIELLEKNFKIFIEENLLSCSNILNIQDWKIINEQLKKIGPQYNNILFKLVYRATRDGDSAEEFHQKCDKIGPNITIVKTIDNNKFGGFTQLNWNYGKENKIDLKEDKNEKNSELGLAKRDSDAFCFSIDLQKIYPNFKKQEAVIFCGRSYGPTFRRNIFAINDKMLTKGGYCMKKENSYFYGQGIDYEISGGKKVFGIKDLEVLEIIFI